MPQQLNLLSLDGGGVKGLSSLYILQKLMEEIDPDDPPKPCDYFDMIGGTSTGGLIAIMLGRLGMSVEDCIDSYVKLSEEVFVKKTRWFTDSHGNIQERYHSQKLEDAIRAVIKQYCSAEDTLMRADEKQRCKVFVCAISKGTSTPELLTTYRRPQGDTALFRHTKIWEAARATSAASSYFDPIAIGPNERTFLDGGTGVNNPVRQLWVEAQKAFCLGQPLEANVNCLVSIGTGIPSLKSFGNKITTLPKSILRIATETEDTANTFLDEHPGLFEDGRCYRLNAPDIGDIAMDRAEKKTEIADKTMHYFKMPDAWKKMTSCAVQLKKREKRTTARSLETTYDKCMELCKLSNWQISPNLGPELEPFNVFEAISDYDPERLLKRLSVKCEGTTTWILSHPRFRRWMEESPPRLFLLSGIVGSGKTTITTTIIETLKDAAGTNAPILYFFFDSKDAQHLSAADPLESFIKQLLGILGPKDAISAEINASIMRFYCPRARVPRQDTTSDKQNLQHGSAIESPFLAPSRPYLRELTQEILLPLLCSAESPILIIDGLDECRSQRGERDELMEIFEQIVSHGVRVLISSREGVVAPGSITDAIHVRVHKVDDDIKKDVARLIDAEISRKTRMKIITKDEGTIFKIREVLLAKADAMFLWVRLLIDGIWHDCRNDAEILAHLKTLPRDLPETYQRCLKRTSVQQQRQAPRILRWVCAAISSFHIEQLREALAIDPKTGQPDQSLEFSEAFIMACGANLLVLDDEDHIVPAHHSVRQWVFSKPASNTENLRVDDRSHVSQIRFDQGQSELAIGETLTSYLSSHLQTLTETHNRVRGETPAKPGFVEAMLPFPIVTKMYFRKKKTLNLNLRTPLNYRPKVSSSKQPHSNHASLFQYAQHHWLDYTTSMSLLATNWDAWCKLVLDQHGGATYPWLSVGRSTLSHLNGLLGWAITQRHKACLFLLLGSIISKELLANMKKNDFWNLPLPNYGNDHPLVVAAKAGHLDTIVQLLRVYNRLPLDAHGNTLLHILSLQPLPTVQGQKVVLEQILFQMYQLREHEREPALCDIQNEHEQTALHIASVHKTHALHEHLLHHTSLHIADDQGDTVLHRAASSGHSLMMEIACRVDLSALFARNGMDFTPLHLAIMGRHVKCVRVLLETSESGPSGKKSLELLELDKSYFECALNSRIGAIMELLMATAVKILECLPRHAQYGLAATVARKRQNIFDCIMDLRYWQDLSPDILLSTFDKTFEIFINHRTDLVLDVQSISRSYTYPEVITMEDEYLLWVMEAVMHRSNRVYTAEWVERIRLMFTLISSTQCAPQKLSTVNRSFATLLEQHDFSGQGHWYYELARLLLQHGADPNVPFGAKGKLSLAQAVSWKDWRLGCILADFGADPLHVPDDRNREIAQILLEHSARSNSYSTAKEELPLMRAIHLGEWRLACFLVNDGADLPPTGPDFEIVQILLEHSTNAHSPSKEDLPLSRAIGLNEWKLARFLIDDGADLPSGGRSCEVAHLLLEHGKNSSSSSATSTTWPITRAIQLKEWQLSRFLINDGASLPPDSRESEIVKLFLEHVTNLNAPLATQGESL